MQAMSLRLEEGGKPLPGTLKRNYLENLLWPFKLPKFPVEPCRHRNPSRRLAALQLALSGVPE